MHKSFTKGDWMRALMAQGLTKAKAREAVEALFAEVKDSLKAGRKVILPGLGTMFLTESKRKRVYNPQKKEVMDFVPRKRVSFKTHPSFKEELRVRGDDRGGEEA
jgi:nucleoid DNA-binding protein